MAKDPKNPQPGELSIDASEVQGFVVDLATGELRGVRREQGGYGAVVQELLSNQATVGSRAGVMKEDLQKLQRCDERIAIVRRYLGPARKLAEMLTETEAVLDEERHQIISTIAASVDQRSRQKDNGDLKGKYEKTRAYRSASAKKGQKTKRKNEQAAQAIQTPEVPGSLPAEASDQ